MTLLLPPHTCMLHWVSAFQRTPCPLKSSGSFRPLVKREPMMLGRNLRNARTTLLRATSSTSPTWRYGCLYIDFSYRQICCNNVVSICLLYMTHDYDRILEGWNSGSARRSFRWSQQTRRCCWAVSSSSLFSKPLVHTIVSNRLK